MLILTPSRNHKSVVARFWEKVRKGPNCWAWVGAKARKGRGVIWVNGHNTTATRISWEIHKRYSPPKDLYICHLCNNPSCVNPKHLYLATHQENLQDASRDGLLATAKDGESNPRSILTENAVRDIRQRYIPNCRGDYGARYFADKYGVKIPAILCVVRRKTWSHVS